VNSSSHLEFWGPGLCFPDLLARKVACLPPLRELVRLATLLENARSLIDSFRRKESDNSLVPIETTRRSRLDSFGAKRPDFACGSDENDTIVEFRSREKVLSSTRR
jgi:precorrin-6B methylase 2